MSWLEIFLKTVAVALIGSMLIEFSEKDEIRGQVTVIDGDTLEIKHQRIQLYGIDAPEPEQLCYINGQPWDCGLTATKLLGEKIGDNSISCLIKGKDRDDDSQLAGECFIGDRSLNAWLVKEGLAIADRRYSDDFVPHEFFARKKNIGVYQSNFLKPSIWRQVNQQDSNGEA
jgi:endonuclease YncB( thermonuclease family)